MKLKSSGIIVHVYSSLIKSWWEHYEGGEFSCVLE